MQSWLSKTLDRRVNFSPESDSDASNTRIGLLGSVGLQAPRIEIAAPEWSKAPHTVRAREAWITLGHADLWQASRGQPLHIRTLDAGDLDVRLELMGLATDHPRVPAPGRQRQPRLQRQRRLRRQWRLWAALQCARVARPAVLTLRARSR